jgi:iron complex transport system substrate-binding protein
LAGYSSVIFEIKGENHLWNKKVLHSRRLIAPMIAITGLISIICAESLFPVHLKDQFQREIMIKKAPQRIISGAPGNTEILFALGLGPRIVGVTSWCDFPAESKSLPKIGDISPLNVEKVLALHPDLVVADILNGKDAVNRLSGFGVPVLTLKANSFHEILDSISLIGRATGANVAAVNLNSRLKNTLEKVKRQAVRVKPLGLKVYVIFGWESNWTAGPGSFLDEAVTLSGASNIAHDLAVPWGKFSTELVLRRNPDVIVTDIQPDKFYSDPVFRKTAAIRKHQVFKIDGGIYYRPGPRLIRALEDLSNILVSCK